MKTNIPTLPNDYCLLPLASSGLLVSPDHAVFCQVPTGEENTVKELLSEKETVTSLRPSRRKDLECHGFFSPGRQGVRFNCQGNLSSNCQPFIKRARLPGGIVV